MTATRTLQERLSARSGLKSGLWLVSRILAGPLLLGYRLEALVLGRERAFRGYSHLVSLVPGVPGDFLRRAFFHATLKRFSPSSQVSFGTIFSTTDVEIAERVFIGAYSIIGHCAIGPDAQIGSRVSIISGLRQHGTTEIGIPIRLQPGRFEKIQIEEDCLVGEGAIIAAHVRKHSVISTGSVVFKEVPPYSVMRGNPAVQIRDRMARPKPPATND